MGQRMCTRLRSMSSYTFWKERNNYGANITLFLTLQRHQWSVAHFLVGKLAWELNKFISSYISNSIFHLSVTDSSFILILHCVLIAGWWQVFFHRRYAEDARPTRMESRWITVCRGARATRIVRSCLWCQTDCQRHLRYLQQFTLPPTTSLRFPPSGIKYSMPGELGPPFFEDGSVLQFLRMLQFLEEFIWSSSFHVVNHHKDTVTYTLTRPTFFYGDSIIETSNREEFEWAFSQVKLCPFVPW